MQTTYLLLLCHRRSATNAIRHSPFGNRQPCMIRASHGRQCVHVSPSFHNMTQVSIAYVCLRKHHWPMCLSDHSFVHRRASCCNKLCVCVDKTDAAEFQSFVHFLSAISSDVHSVMAQTVDRHKNSRQIPSYSIVNHLFHPSSWSCTHSQTHSYIHEHMHFVRQFRKTVLWILVLMT